MIWFFTKERLGKVYNIGGNCELTNMDITEKILKLTGRDKSFIKPAADRLGHDFRYAIDNAEINNELGWKPKINFSDGIKMTLEYYRKSDLN